MGVLLMLIVTVASSAVLPQNASHVLRVARKTAVRTARKSVTQERAQILKKRLQNFTHASQL
jgi:hypothetical protein